MPATRKKSTPTQASSSSPDDMQNRIDRLEGLVLSLMTNGSQSAGPAAAAAAISRTTSIDLSPLSHQTQNVQEDNDKQNDDQDDSDVESVANQFGILKVDNERGKSMYLGDNHWHLILADIAEVKAYFASHGREMEAQSKKVASANPVTAQGGLVFLFGMHTPVTESELRAALPNRAATEKLVSRYFNSYDAAVNILHYPTFHQQLIDHHKDPSKSSIVWIALLFSILCLSMQSHHKIGDEPPEWKGVTLQLACEYRMRTVQCLVASDYTKSVDHTIEALLLYVHGEYTSRWDAEVGIWVIMGMIVRLAMRMGYHRDPCHFAALSPFQGEMRRRVWAFLRQCDVMFSFQIALPNLVRAGDCDTSLPRNIFEDEFSKATKELPPARPFTEPTPVSYMLANSKLGLVFGEIVTEVNALRSQATYDAVMKIDEKLRDVKRTMPHHLQLRPLEESAHDPATLLMQRFNLDILYQKSMCVLHRKYLVRARTNQRYAHSRRACVEASMEILRHQATLHRESLKGGRMRTMRWFISSLTKNDFLLGAMIVCLDLHYDSITKQYDRFFWTAEQQKSMYDALEMSKSIWVESQETSMEAYKASSTLTIMLEKLRYSRPKGPSSNEPQAPAEAFATYDDTSQPEHSAAMTLGMLSSGGMTPNTASMFAPGPGLINNNIGMMKYGNVDMTMSDSGMHTGLTPNYPADGAMQGSTGGVQSPFSQVFGNMGSMMDMPSNFDWESWDSYVQNGNPLDGLQNYPPGYDPMASNASDQNDPNNLNNSVFMGANTPGKMQ
ncbi:MAG: hypothetical protein M1818_002814 [Claussenomyces sp. TS43310]|nr:MAG: hypothetical protein M1818_002814 [Claussenomyces sp. TS43310]